ncbi:hypothetical protein [Streptomyces sp. SID8352]|uniref:hypothetical protein n=1 Tax=Streptomyces sp. SID8352 TaxID=2690338 RepID=UPI00136FC883|nr:hypothetical protein [Streptomyces sp. SID8352]MYU25504.1 hypothetical protein [Streptomyces sp. SID8352]
MTPEDLTVGRAAGYCWITFGPRQLHCCRPPGHANEDGHDGEDGHATPYGGGPGEFRSRLAPRRPSQ